MDQVQQIAQTFGVDWPHLAAQTISFSIVCGLLYWLAYRPVLAMLAARREQISKGLANAAKIDAELKKTEGMRQDVLARSRAEGERLIEDSRTAAARLAAQQTQQAQAAARDIIAAAQEAVAQDRVRMMAELKRDIGRLVLQTTAAVTGKVLTPDDQRRLAEDTARHLQK